MKKPALYSSTVRSPWRSPSRRPVAAAPGVAATAPSPDPSEKNRIRVFIRQHQRAVLVFAGMLFTLLPVLIFQAIQEPPQEIAQDDIDAAVIHTLETKSLQSRAARAAESVRQSVVRVHGYSDDPMGPMDPRRPKVELKPAGVGSGVVIVDKGVILTNLHVVNGMKRVVITFFDGLESEADLISTHPENDLAVLRARTIPDDLPAATIGSSASLKPGDEVVAVGFPFGIGPSVSAGVVSGLNREFRAPDGKHVLTQLIQFDAAANPGNSGGPLVTMDGEVVGIVTAIYNPNETRTFIGIGFAATIAVAGNMVGISPF